MAYHVFDAAAADRLVRNPRGGVARDFHRRGERVLRAQQRLVGRTSGTLARDLHINPLRPPFNPGVEVGSDLPRARHHASGHGVIVPVRAEALRFRPKGSQRFIFAKRVRPVPPNRFLQRSLQAARRSFFA